MLCVADVVGDVAGGDVADAGADVGVVGGRVNVRVVDLWLLMGRP